MDQTPPLLVACLCAQWCGSCRDYAATFAALAATHGAAVRTRWIDIEDEAALVDEVEVDNFPTLLIARGPQLLFFGTITPQAATLARLVDGALAGTLPAPQVAPGVEALAARIAAQAAA